MLVFLDTLFAAAAAAGEWLHVSNGAQTGVSTQRLARASRRICCHHKPQMGLNGL